MTTLPYTVQSPERVYVFEEKISGSRASYRARSEGKLYFVKVGESPRRAARLQREVTVVQRLVAEQTPGIIPVTEAFAAATEHYIVFPYIAGANLDKWLPGNRPAEELVPIINDVAKTLDAAHNLGIVHLDLKPANLHLADAVYTVDWEAAKYGTLPQFQPSRQYFSTIGYVSPEVALGEAPDRRSDVYQLAGIVYAVLTGKKPNAGTPEEVRANIANQQARRRSLEDRLLLGPALWQAIARGLAFKRGDRQQSAGEFAHDFAEAVKVLEARRLGG